MRTKEELMSLGLPKWPQCIITGTTLPKDQALEVIRRTDIIFNGPIFANDKQYVEWLTDVLKFPKETDDAHSIEGFHEYWRKWHEWKGNWGYTHLQYLHNDWICCDMAQGCQGWCHPDGIIDYHFNIGKWPEVEEVWIDLDTIAKQFPFVELECTLMDSEYGEDNSPIVSFLVRNREVEIIDPKERNVHEEFGRTVWKPTPESDAKMRSVVFQLLNCGSLHAIPNDVILQWAADQL